MPKSNQSINADLEELLVSKGYDVTPLDSSGKPVPVSDSADLMQFHFHRDGKDYGTVTVTIDGLQKLTVYYDDEIANSGGMNESGDDRGMNGTSWISLVKQLKKFAQQHQLGYVLKDTDRLRNDMKKRAHQKTLEESSQLKDDLEFMTESSFKKFYGVGKRQVKENKQMPRDEASIRKEIAELTDEAKWYLDHGRNKAAQRYVEKIEDLRKQLPQTKTGLDIDRSVPGITRARISDIDPGTMGNKLDKLEPFRNFQAGVADQGGSGRVRPKISSDNYTQRDDVAEGFGDVVKGVKRKVAGKKDPREVEHMYARTARRDIDDANKLNNQAAYDARDKSVKRSKKISKVVNKEGVAEGSGQEPGWFEIYNLRTMQRVHHPFEAENIMDAEVKADDWLEAIGKSGRGLAVRPIKEQGVAEGWKEKVAGGVLGAAALGGIGAGIAYSPMAYVNGQQIQMAMPTSIPDNAKLVTADDGRKIYVWKSNSIKGRAVWHYRPAEQVKEQGVAANSQTKLDEGYYGNRKMSYSDDTPTVKMIIKHNRQLEETDQRFRHIERIFLETSNGERFVVETTKPSRARMFARHIAEGGGYKDERWNHIKEICEDIDSLGGFIRATRSSEQFNESAQRMISEVADKYSELKTTAKRLQTGRGYNSYFESYEPSSKNENSDDLLEVFKHSSVDSRIERALPTLNKLGIRRGILEEADIFEEWAESVIDESLDVGNDRQAEAIVELFADELPVGPNAEVAIAELGDIIEDDDLYKRLRRVAAVNPNNDARPQIIAWMQEQDTPEYRNLLSKLEKEDGDSPEDKKEVEKSDSSKSIEPEKVVPKKKKPNQTGDMTGGSPPLPGGSGDMTGGLPPLPPLPPLKEGDGELASFKRLIGK